MKDDLSTETIQKLNLINADFYNKTALFFDNSRSYNWEGWDIMIERLNINSVQEKSDFGYFWTNLFQKFFHKNKSTKPLQVLDMGCGNGRFYGFLHSRLQVPFNYVGIDTNQFLLEKSIERYPYPNAQFFLENMGNVDHIFNIKFDLIVIFGVMHHIPGTETRIKMLKKCRNLLSKNGNLVFTTWKFLDIPRIAKSIVKEDTPLGVEIYRDLGISSEELGVNDYILDWQRGVTAYRYCHYYTETEVQKLIQISGLNLVETYEADGLEGDLNQYYICRVYKKWW